MASREVLACRRCRRPVEASQEDYETFAQMHYVCFHYEFEHDPVDVDLECQAGGCPSRRGFLRDALDDWTDWDLAAFRLGRAIGLYERDDDWRRAKGTSALAALADGDVLERRSEPDDQFRWRGR